MNKTITMACGITAVMSLFSASVSAQTSTNVVDSKSDWSVFVENNPQRCWSVSKPTKTVNTRDGNPVVVNRSDIRFFVTYSPASGVTGQISFTGGYPIKPNSLVTLSIGSETYTMYPTGEYAWPETSAVDTKIRASMKRGATAVVQAQSARGTKTTDTFSLVGFTAALAETEKRCSN